MFHQPADSAWVLVAVLHQQRGDFVRPGLGGVPCGDIIGTTVRGGESQCRNSFGSERNAEKTTQSCTVEARRQAEKYKLVKTHDMLIRATLMPESSISARSRWSLTASPYLTAIRGD